MDTSSAATATCHCTPRQSVGLVSTSSLTVKHPALSYCNLSRLSSVTPLSLCFITILPHSSYIPCPFLRVRAPDTPSKHFYREPTFLVLYPIYPTTHRERPWPAYLAHRSPPLQFTERHLFPFIFRICAGDVITIFSSPSFLPLRRPNRVTCRVPRVRHSCFFG